ncbi:MAG: hypothetical protein Q9M36_11225 [Sulfurovum sp.]|nr:hypothetical protein [Sulfurovum sp.]
MLIPSTITATKTLIHAMALLMLTLALSLASYYLYSPFLRELTLAVMILALFVLFYAMYQDLKQSCYASWVIVGILLILLGLYFVQRMELHRFDFMVGDASDYFAAGICAVTYSQDIGYILPLSATFTAIGYAIFGIEYALLPYVIFYASSIPLFYFLFRLFGLSRLIALMMTLLMIVLPLSIWYAKSSFSETLWQILLFVFVLNSYFILQQPRIGLIQLFILLLILGLAPLLRVEGVFFYALLLFLLLYHFWKFQHFFSMLWLSFGFFILAISIHISLYLRPSYLLDRQYSRILADATQQNVMLWLYSLALLFFVFIFLWSYSKKYMRKYPISRWIVLLSLVSKGLLAYIYSVKKDVDFIDMLCLNEYGFALGNFGWVLSSLMIVGMLLLYIRAYSGEDMAVIFVVIYSVFYLPFLMQSVRFEDAHAFLFYWNRYYFSVLMVVHIFALGLILQYAYTLMHKIMHYSRTMKPLFILGLVLLLGLSFDTKLHQIVVKESHLKGSYALYPWVQKYVGRQGISLVTQAGVIYTQNARPEGRQQIEYLIGRTFSLYKMPIKGHHSIPSQSDFPYAYPLHHAKAKFVLCVAQEPCLLDNPALVKLDSLVLPLEWREHFGLATDAKQNHEYRLSHSLVQKRTLYATLYKVMKYPKP